MFSGQFFAAGLNLTEDAKYVLSHPCQSLQSMTLNSYSLLLNWVKQQRPGPSKSCVNIICADFVGAFSSEFTHLVIGLNQTLLKETWLTNRSAINSTFMTVPKLWGNNVLCNTTIYRQSIFRFLFDACLKIMLQATLQLHQTTEMSKLNFFPDCSWIFDKRADWYNQRLSGSIDYSITCPMSHT